LRNLSAINWPQITPISQISQIFQEHKTINIAGASHGELLYKEQAVHEVTIFAHCSEHRLPSIKNAL